MKAKHFEIYELVDRQIYESRGERAWELIDPRLIETMDEIREHFGAPVTINNWKWGGPFSNRCFRAPACEVGASLSQHRWGRGSDFDVKGYTAEEVRAEIIRARKEEGKFKHIGAIELGVNWVHIDVRNTDRGTPETGGIFTFYP